MIRASVLYQLNEHIIGECLQQSEVVSRQSPYGCVRRVSIFRFMYDANACAGVETGLLYFSHLTDPKRTLLSDTSFERSPNRMDRFPYSHFRITVKKFNPVNGEGLFIWPALKPLGKNPQDIVILILSQPRPWHISHDVIVVRQVRYRGSH